MDMPPSGKGGPRPGRIMVARVVFIHAFGEGEMR